MPEEKRILVEFYDHEPLENLISLLHGRYSGVVYVFFHSDREPNPREQKILSRLVKKKFGLCPRFLEIERKSLSCALEHLQALLTQDAFFDFDITGGDSLFIAAAGMLCARTEGKNLAIHEYEAATGRLLFRFPEGREEAPRWERSELTIEEVLALRDSTILNPEESLLPPAVRGETRELVGRMWEALRHDLRTWNVFCSKPAHTEFYTTYVEVTKRLERSTDQRCVPVLRDLTRNGLASRVRRKVSGDTVRLSYRIHCTPEQYPLFDKGGSLLELLTYCSVLDMPGTTDCRFGVRLDWCSDGSKKGVNLSNEVDGIAIREGIPWFISCKNTGVENDYFYEVKTMARHFGGAYAVPMLITTVRCSPSAALRAKEMGIVLVQDVQSMTTDELVDALRRAACNFAAG